jgi:hypothetical protein
MLRAARRACLGAAAAKRIARFLRSQANPDGGFRGRSETSDLYYTVFGLMALDALGVEIPAAPLRKYLDGFETGASLDLVHLSALARCWSFLPAVAMRPRARLSIISNVQKFEKPDGGYGSVYGCFLALGTHQDLGQKVRNPSLCLAWTPSLGGGLARCIRSLRCEDGGYANEAGLPMGLTPATAAAIVVLRELGEAQDPAAAQWLLARMQREGGFLAMPAAPVPDLLSTATALHALHAAGIVLTGEAQAACRKFVEGLLASGGGFRGHAADDTADCEYTFYGLLALGHLSGET